MSHKAFFLEDITIGSLGKIILREKNWETLYSSWPPQRGIEKEKYLLEDRTNALEYQIKTIWIDLFKIWSTINLTY